MTGPGLRGPGPASLRRPGRLCAVLAVLLVQRCATAPPPGPRDHFPLDPREGLQGPFDDSIGAGWQALLAGDPARAEREFGRVARRSLGSRPPGSGRSRPWWPPGARATPSEPARPRRPTRVRRCPCSWRAARSEARAGSPVEAYELYARAAAEGGPARPGLFARAQKLLDRRDRSRARRGGARSRERAATKRLGPASRGCWPGTPAPLRSSLGRPTSSAPRVRRNGPSSTTGRRWRSGASASRTGSGRAGSPSKSATTLSPCRSSTPSPPRTPDLRKQAAQARLAFRIANWPEAERQTARSRRLTRSGAAGSRLVDVPGGARSSGRGGRRRHRRARAAGQPADDPRGVARTARRGPGDAPRASGCPAFPHGRRAASCCGWRACCRGPTAGRPACAARPAPGEAARTQSDWRRGAACCQNRGAPW